MNSCPDEVDMMKKKGINLELTIRFSSPFIIGSGFGIAGLIDLTTVKDTDNIVYLPASSLKGKVRSEFKKNMEAMGIPVCNSTINGRTDICKAGDIKDACVICRVFGSVFHPGCLIFEDAVMDDETMANLREIVKNRMIPAFQSSVRTGIRINRWLKTAEEGALFTFETVNSSFVFKSSIKGRCYISDNEYSYFTETIRMITHLGGNKAGGMGRCEVEVKEQI
jgi:CRISPR/Cas system CSM-associated protein Csm3 (group 7 of RAMP superfamily)